MSARSDVDLLTSGAVAGIFKVERYTVTRWGATGRLVSVRTLGGHLRFFAVEVNALRAGVTREKARELGLAEKARLSQGRRD